MKIMKINKIYISGALTIIDEKKNLKSIYENIAKFCADYCDNIYVPHLGGTDPIKNPLVTPQEVWEKDHKEVSSSDLVIAYVGTPSLGVGAELEIARFTTSKIVLWYFKGEKVSRMALGNPAVVEKLEVEDEKELMNKLKLILEK